MMFKEIGRVVKFNAKRGWGFIEMLPCMDRVFVHYSAIRMDGYKALREGDYVMLNVDDTPDGLKARSVYLLHPDDALAAIKQAM